MHIENVLKVHHECIDVKICVLIVILPYDDIHMDGTNLMLTCYDVLPKYKEYTSMYHMMHLSFIVSCGYLNQHLELLPIYIKYFLTNHSL